MYSVTTVLVAQSDAEDYSRLKEAFRAVHAQCSFKQAHNTGEILAYLEGAGRFSDRAEFPVPNLWLLDSQVTGQRTFEVLRRLKLESEPFLVPVVLLCRSDGEQYVDRAYHLGASSVVEKPTDPEAWSRLARILADYWLRWNLLPHRR